MTSASITNAAAVGGPAGPPDVTRSVLGTALQITSYAAFTARCQHLTRSASVTAVDFSNTQIVTMRRHEPEFRELTRVMDCFVPDGMPLIWCLNVQGAGLRDRVYGPTFMRHCVLASPAPFTHFFLGGSEDCLAKLQSALREQNSQLQIVGAQNGYFKPEDEPRILERINQLSPDFIWVGLGTPKQQAWIQRNKARLRRGVVFAVGFAFDVNAGTKPDAPPWMQRLGLTWVFRLLSEPRRLLPRYVKYNSLFLGYLLWDGLRGRAFTPAGVPTSKANP